MKQLRMFLNRYSLMIGILLMFLFTWPIDLANSGVLPFQVPFAVYIFIGYGIVFASLIMTGLTRGKEGIVALLKHFLIWRVKWQWYLVAFLLYPTIFFSAVLLNAIITQTNIDFSTAMAHQIFGPAASLPLLVLPFFLFDAIANGEEVGWRGYVLPRLLKKHSALVSSLILGVIWGLWHLPRYLAPENTNSFLLFLVRITADAVLYTWLYKHTRGSLLLVTIFHAAGNTAGMFLPLAATATGSSLTLIIQLILIVSLAAIVTAIEGPAQLSRAEPGQAQA